VTERYYTTSSAFLEALAEAGISYIFANLGSDHPGIIEALAQAKADGRADELPKLIICPHETVALSAAHAYAMVTGEPQAVVVHVDSGTQNIGGMVNNAMRGRAPVLVFAGTVPYTQNGELPGSRTEFIQWIQDVRDQRGILRNYVKYDNELRTGRNVKQLVHRALQIARSEPAGPVYLTGAREVMEERIEPYQVDAGSYPPVAPAALTAEVTAEIATALAGARHPLIVTSYLGRDPAAVPSLVALAELLAIPVLEAMAYHVNFPDDSPLHAGFQYHSTGQNPVLAEADVILVLDSDVPWIPSVNRPAAGAAVYYVDIDPLKSQMQLWDVPARRFAAANSKVAVEQIAAFVRDHDLVDGALDDGEDARLLGVIQTRQVDFERLLKQWIDLLLTVGVPGHPNGRPVVVAEPAGQRRVAGHPAAGGERDLHQLARREHPIDVVGADEHLRAPRAMAGVTAHSGALDPQFRHGSFLPNMPAPIAARGPCQSRSVRP